MLITISRYADQTSFSRMGACCWRRRSS